MAKDPPAGARFVFIDLARRELVQPVFETIDAVCHLGEIPNVHAGLSPDEVYAQNTRAGAIVLQTAADLKLKRVIYTSSCQAYGMWEGSATTPAKLPFDETQPLRPHNAYALGKAAMEAYAELVAEQSGLSVAIFRLPWVPVEEYSDRQAEYLREPPTRTDGFATYCHVNDVARAYALAIENPRPGCEAYHFAAAEILSLYPLGARLAAHHPAYPKLPADWPAFKSPLITNKAREHFGWEAKWNFLHFYRRAGGEFPDVSDLSSART